MIENTHDAIRCPECRAWMQAGFVSVSQGLSWMRTSDGSANDFAETIPGTHAVMRPNRLPAWRCRACRLVTFRFGDTKQRERDMHEDEMTFTD